MCFNYRLYPKYSLTILIGIFLLPSLQSIFASENDLNGRENYIINNEEEDEEILEEELEQDNQENNIKHRKRLSRSKNIGDPKGSIFLKDLFDSKINIFSKESFFLMGIVALLLHMPKRHYKNDNCEMDWIKNFITRNIAEQNKTQLSQYVVLKRDESIINKFTLDYTDDLSLLKTSVNIGDDQKIKNKFLDNILMVIDRSKLTFEQNKHIVQLLLQLVTTSTTDEKKPTGSDIIGHVCRYARSNSFDKSIIHLVLLEK